MRGLLITGTGTGVGKTLVGCLLARAARGRGLRVGVFKPAETGCAEVQGTLEPADAQQLLLASGADFALDLVCPYRYRSPLAPAVAAEVDQLAPPCMDALAACFQEIGKLSDLVLVEGAGGIRVPITWEADYADLALALDLEVVVVVGNRLGCLNSALLTFDYASARGLRLRGYVLNDCASVQTAATATNESSLRRLTDVACLGRLGFKEPLSPATISALLDVS